MTMDTLSECKVTKRSSPNILLLTLLVRAGLKCSDQRPHSAQQPWELEALLVHTRLLLVGTGVVAAAVSDLACPHHGPSLVF